MADLTKYLSYEGLSHYDEKLKALMTANDAATLQSAKNYADAKVKASAKDADYKTANTYREKTNPFNVITAEEYETLTEEQKALYEKITITATIGQALSALEEAVGEGGSVATQIKEAIEALDSEKSQTAGADGLALSITEVDGKITAISGSIAAETYDAYGAAAAAQTASVVTVEKKETADDGYLSSYVVKQNGTQVGSTINIPKDYLVKSADLKTVTTEDQPYAGAKVGDKYLDFVINTKDASVTDEHIYIPVNDLFDSYTSGSATGDAIIIDVNNTTNKISASVTDGTIARAKITADFESDIAKLEGTHVAGETAGTYKTVAQEVADGINALDATVKQELDASSVNALTTGLSLEVVETDGKLTSVVGKIETVTNSDIDALFPAAGV